MGLRETFAVPTRKVRPLVPCRQKTVPVAAAPRSLRARSLVTRTPPVVLAVALLVSLLATLLPALLVGGPAIADVGDPPATDVAGGPDPARAIGAGVYVVTLAAPPAAAYTGGLRDLPATSPVHGERFDRTRPAVARYARHLTAAQDRVLERVGGPVVLYRYTTALDGFAAALTGSQVRALRSAPGVLRVERSTKQHLDATTQAGAGPTPDVGSSTRTLLGLTGPRGAWARLGGPGRAGEGVVVGVVDSGIWPENPSFSGLADSTPGTAPALPGFHGECAPAERWTVEHCTDKVVSAQWFVRGFGAENIAGADFLSARDGTGHGSHAASVAAGDAGVRVEVDGQSFGTTSGMAPAARLALYKACWTAPEPAEDGCTTADTVAAVDRAVADGVDVLSASVSGSRRPDDSVERAFLGAASAGVFVAASAGNAGRPGSVGHVAPWVSTVAASTHHDFAGEVRLGNGRSLMGAMVPGRRAGPAGLVLGSAVAAPSASPTSAGRCATGSLDAALVEGRIVVCDRGGGARVDKSAAVAAAGGVGMVLGNTGPESVDADVHAVPTVHLDAEAAAAVRSYTRTAGPAATATLDPQEDRAGRVPAVAGFSSRGPAAGFGGEVLKPDLTAPGVSVLGAVAPPSDSGRWWDLRSGTSTSAPHVAGLAALLAGAHPDWSPARVRSAMMTTARDLVGRHDPLVEGAGQVDARRLLDPGLVFDTGPAAWRRVAAGDERARDVNTPWVAVGDLVGPTTVLRTVTNVGRATESYAVRVRGLRGVDVQAFPATVRLAPGRSRTVRLRITPRPTARAGRDVTGWLVWRGSRHRVRVPVSARPTVVSAPEEVRGTGDRGSVVVRGRSGNGRTVKLRSSGLVPATSTPVVVTPGRASDVRSVRVPPGTAVVRFAVALPGEDLAVGVYRGDQRVAGASRATGASPAVVTVPRPVAGTYRVRVGVGTPAGGARSGRLDTWVVPERGGSPVTLSTDAVGFAPGRRFGYSASWTGLDPARRYLGVVAYGDSGLRTLLAVDASR